MEFVITPKGKGYVLEYKLDKVKVQLVDSYNFATRQDWFEISEVKPYKKQLP